MPTAVQKWTALSDNAISERQQVDRDARCGASAMTVYFVELGFCFQPRPTNVFMVENNACISLDQANEDSGGDGGGPQPLAPWTDGTFWQDFDGTWWLDRGGWQPVPARYRPCGSSGMSHAHEIPARFRGFQIRAG